MDQYGANTKIEKLMLTKDCQQEDSGWGETFRNENAQVPNSSVCTWFGATSKVGAVIERE